MDIRQDGQLIGDFLEAEARALRKRDVGDPVKGRFAVPAVATARPALGRDQSELLIVTQRVQVATGDIDTVLRKMFGVRGEAKRINAAEMLGLPEYKRLKLSTDFEKAIRDVRYCLKIRNQYAHFVPRPAMLRS
jgi:hypothetical protein